MAHLVLRPFIDAYRVVAHELACAPIDEEIDTDQFLDGCLRLGKQWALQRRIASEESMSNEMFGTALKMARHRRLLSNAAGDIADRRRPLVSELDEVLQSIEILAAEQG